MLAWKFLASGRVAPFTGVRWPEPGVFIEAKAPPEKGVHACAIEDLPFWFDDELWQVELDGAVVRGRRQLIAPRGRLIARVGTWTFAKGDFTGACVARTRDRVVDALLARGHTAEADRLASEINPDAMRDTAADLAAHGFDLAGYVFDAVRRGEHPGLCSYIAANAAAAIDGGRGHDAERAMQAAWLRDRLQLT